MCLCLGGMKCPQCEFVYGTKWELNRHLKNKHSMKVVEGTWGVKTVHRLILGAVRKRLWTMSAAQLYSVEHQTVSQSNTEPD